MAKRIKKPYEAYGEVSNVLKAGFDTVLSTREQIQKLEVPEETEQKLANSLLMLKAAIDDFDRLKVLKEAEWKELLSQFRIVG